MNTLFEVIRPSIEADVLTREIVIPIPKLLDENPSIIVLIYRFSMKAENDKYVYTFSGASIR